MHRVLVLLAGSLMMLTSTALWAEQFWSHKDWQVREDKGRCRMATGGDGNDSFSLEFSAGGTDGSARYAPLLIRGYPPTLTVGDAMSLDVDGKSHWLGDEFQVFDGEDEWHEYFVAASIPGGLVPELVTAFSAANGFELRKETSDGAKSLAKFSLQGFSATLLKAAEWCHFDPSKLPSS